MKKLLLALLLVVVALLLASAIYLGAKHPSNDRTWDPAFSKLNTIDFNQDGSITIHDLRDFTYATGTIATMNWRDETVRPEDIEGAYFFLDLFAPSTPEVGHTFMAFRFKNGETIAFSIEARREAGEKYTFIGGFLRDYELQYLWGEERDLVGQRVIYKNEQLYRLPLTISNAQAATLFTEFGQETNALAQTPRWYNTLTANCTNLLAKIINKYQPGTLPYDISWNLTGLADGYLERVGLINTGGQSRDDFRATHDLTIHRSELAAHATDSPAQFEAFISTLIP